MNFQIEHTFGWPRDEIVGILATGEEPVPMDSLPNVSTYKVYDFSMTGEGFLKKIEWSVQGKIPSFAKHVIRPDMLKFDEETTWVNHDSTFTTRVLPHFLKDKIHCVIVVKWDSDGDGKSRRRADFNVKVRIPFIGGKLENMIAEILKQNNERYTGLLNESFTEMLGQPGS